MINKQWIEIADRAIKEAGIVKDDAYPKVFKGYISSFASKIQNIGLYQALIVYENKQTRTEAERYRLLHAVLYLLSSKVLYDSPLKKDVKLSEQYSICENKKTFLRNLEKALSVLKYTFRMYKGVDSLTLKQFNSEYSELDQNLLNGKIINFPKNRRNIDLNWTVFADVALNHVRIIKNKVYPKVFKGYIASLSSSIVTMGFYPSLLVFENEKSKATGDRQRLVAAILYMLSYKGDEEVIKKSVWGGLINFESLLDKPLHNNIKLSDQYLQSQDKKTFQRDVQKALFALKFAIRKYEPKDKLVLDEFKIDYEAITYQPVTNNNVQKLNALSPNVGWLFYRDYYRNYTTNASVFAEKNQYIFNSRLKIGDEYTAAMSDNKRLSSNLGKYGFIPLTFKTMYPGLIIGLGLTHGTAVDNDLKCGFQFDYTTGLPYIPGSSVKGVLRSMFPFKGDKKEDVKFHYIESLLKADNNKILENKEVDFSKEDIEELAENIFEHKGKATYDVFMDAIITGCTTKDGKFLSDDFITPQHKKPFGNPEPIQFMKVLPDVEFTFFFKFTECKCNGVDINLKELFRCILEDIGIGAKTNVGYGQLELIE